MSAPKFTPGPWRVGPSHEEGSCEYIDHGIYTAGSVAVLYSTEDGSHETRRANAALIAAAPELYEALREVKSALEDHLLVQPNSAFADAGRDLVSKINAALAKAECR